MIPDEPARGGYPDPRLFGLSGLEQLRAFFRGQGIPPPISYLTGTVITDVGSGTATFEMPATGWMLAPVGFIGLGVLAGLADAPLGCAVQTSLPPFTAYTTAELSLNYVRPVVADGGTLRAHGSLIHGGRSLALSDVVIEDERGRLLAHGTSRCVVFPPMGPPAAEPPEIEPVELPTYDTPHPWEREVQGEVLPQEVWDRMSGLEVLRGLADGSLPAPPLTHLTGLRPTDAEEGTATFVMPASEWLCSPLRTVQGGMIGMLADTVMMSAVQTTIAPRTAYSPVDLKVNFLRPVHPDGRALTARGSIVHRGKTVAVANAEVVNADGKRVAVATGTAMLFPDTPWSREPSPDTADDEQVGAQA